MSKENIDCNLDEPTTEDLRKLLLLPLKRYYGTPSAPATGVLYFYSLVGYGNNGYLVRGYDAEKESKEWTANFEHAGKEFSWRLSVPAESINPDEQTVALFSPGVLSRQAEAGVFERDIQRALNAIIALQSKE